MGIKTGTRKRERERRWGKDGSRFIFNAMLPLPFFFFEVEIQGFSRRHSFASERRFFETIEFFCWLYAICYAINNTWLWNKNGVACNDEIVIKKAWTEFLFFFFSFGRIRFESINMARHARPGHNRDVNYPRNVASKRRNVRRKLCHEKHGFHERARWRAIWAERKEYDSPSTMSRVSQRGESVWPRQNSLWIASPVHWAAAEIKSRMMATSSSSSSSRIGPRISR